MRPCLAALALILPALPAFAGGLSGFTLPPYAQVQNPIVPGETWGLIKEDVIGDIALLDGEDLFSLDAPVTAFDAATVPFAIRQKDPAKRIEKMVLVVDENPVPIAAAFEFGPAMGDMIELEGRVRYDVFSNIRALATTNTGQTYMVGRFVEAAGGCSAPVARDLNTALSTLGQMKLKVFGAKGGVEMSGAVKEAQVMIRHPNFTGMQQQVDTLSYIDPRFVDNLEVLLGEELLFRMSGGFSISENPTFRFSYRDNGAQTITVRGSDTEGAVFEQVFPIKSGV